ncbi:MULTISPECIES: ABC transporter ATP-binding protein [Pseudoalteromonas]|uniref:ABC transporter ATP-binding protein n=1 Tax=Pseudoalteromonas TaxID=53246 RepID=UPI00029AEA7B|nr:MULTISPECIES: ABC transporter ATP-binding protein [Pseudoalteromonas]AUJ69072.1 Lipoprotein-releasing system ATP-binding protein LolD [Pseudoalteromonas sp. NC201]MCF2829128.1 ABC transporter ATP-binding protein [Pseudoalteromonas sp. OF5H-5]MCF2831565.1 ABC transporter ATP-binding protein [Pseudoalteromonas sp. DL2-H6]MCF2927677.1 ABC transporter ATP-binding protein [Pseudoalteromonas sp. DL2-H1]MCF7515598.1 ABC transporter ATP-binding protein [Pseudoalteromonas sp. L7]
MTNKTIIQLDNIEKKFSTEDVETYALSQISLTINSGDYIAITGPSGCGKSTLLSLIGLLDVPSAGKYVLSGHDVSQISRDERAAIRNEHIGFVFQSFNLISDMTVEENIALPLSYRNNIDQKQISHLIDFALEKVDMQHRRKHFPSQLSGGQQQRVAIARAIAGKPALILADEPTGNLDSKNTDAVLELLKKLHNEGTTIVMVTHDPRSAGQANRQVEMFDGKIVADQVVSAKNSAA